MTVALTFGLLCYVTLAVAVFAAIAGLILSDAPLALVWDALETSDAATSAAVRSVRASMPRKSAAAREVVAFGRVVAVGSAGAGLARPSGRGALRSVVRGALRSVVRGALGSVVRGSESAVRPSGRGSESAVRGALETTVRGSVRALESVVRGVLGAERAALESAVRGSIGARNPTLALMAGAGADRDGLAVVRLRWVGGVGAWGVQGGLVRIGAVGGAVSSVSTPVSTVRVLRVMVVGSEVSSSLDSHVERVQEVRESGVFSRSEATGARSAAGAVDSAGERGALRVMRVISLPPHSRECGREIDSSRDWAGRLARVRVSGEALRALREGAGEAARAA